MIVPPHPAVEDCVFCTRRDQPAELLHTQDFYVMPDKYPLVPGHTLVISQRPIRCHALGDDDSLLRLEELAGRVGAFLESVYGTPVMALENGIAGQSVFHAHLHLLPMGVAALPEAMRGWPDVTPIEGWGEVRRRLTETGSYRYLAMGGGRYVTDGHSPALRPLREAMRRGAGIELDSRSAWIKRTTDADVDVLQRLWRERGDPIEA
ncbi:MAG TPA: HIT family protein [Candidatus Dormibacteraeota bacterium]|jgi:diadenosine tetraphosphate (Ap4A) HIT family hydrolase|nr:HIT family protein [Candidatus Dormibacteraeota bacterium]